MLIYKVDTNSSTPVLYAQINGDGIYVSKYPGYVVDKLTKSWKPTCFNEQLIDMIITQELNHKLYIPETIITMKDYNYNEYMKTLVSLWFMLGPNKKYIADHIKFAYDPSYVNYKQVERIVRLYTDVRIVVAINISPKLIDLKLDTGIKILTAISKYYVHNNKLIYIKHNQVCIFKSKVLYQADEKIKVKLYKCYLVCFTSNTFAVINLDTYQVNMFNFKAYHMNDGYIVYKDCHIKLHNIELGKPDKDFYMPETVRYTTNNQIKYADERIYELNRRKLVINSRVHWITNTFDGFKVKSNMLAFYTNNLIEVYSVKNNCIEYMFSLHMKHISIKLTSAGMIIRKLIDEYVYVDMKGNISKIEPIDLTFVF
jgi:hypothetical protein